MTRLIGFERGDLPVFVCWPTADDAAALSLDLRSYGLRTRVFTHLPVLETAARSHLPLAILLHPAHAPEAARRGLRRSLEAAWDTEVPVAVVGGERRLDARLQAIAAGAAAYFPAPVNRHGLTAFLHGLMRAEADPAPSVAVVARPGTELAASVGRLTDDSLRVRIVVPEERLPDQLEDDVPDLLIVDADMRQPDGIALAAALRQVPGMAVVPIMAGTAADKRSLDADAAAAGVDRLFGLPVDPYDLRAMALALIARFRDRRSAYRLMGRRDPATGLLNRDHFLDTLLQTPVRRSETTPCAVLCFAVPEPQPDAESAARSVADRLQRVLPPSAPTARLDRHLFAALVDGPDPESLRGLCAGVEERLALPDQTEGESPALRTGAVLVDRRHRSLLEALEEAQSRLGPARGGSPGSAWSARVRDALAQNRFRLVFQPVSSLNGHHEDLFETFVRMLDAQGEDILPLDFLAAAREAGLAPRLDRWVLERAVRILADRTGASTPTLFVKLFPESVADPELLPWLTALLQREAVAAERLAVEIPHSSVLHQHEPVARLLQGLKRLGCLRTVEYFDDRSDPALAALDLPLDFLKLSEALTQELPGDPDLQRRVQQITSRCRERGIASIASRVQDAAALSLLWRCGVEYIQGNFMQEPADVFGLAARQAADA